MILEYHIQFYSFFFRDSCAAEAISDLDEFHEGETMVKGKFASAVAEDLMKGHHLESVEKPYTFFAFVLKKML